MKYVIIGGAGAMGRITVKDLVETCPKNGDTEIVVADYDAAKADALAASHKDPRVTAVRVDVKNPSEAARVLAGAFVVINATQYQLNLDVMEIALRLGCHYVDLGGLFHVTRKQLELDGKFRAIGKTALLGMGAAPGITNILSRYGADQLDTVTEIHTRVGSMDSTRYEPKPALAVAYSLQTILEEFSYEPAVYTKGEFKFVKPMSGDVPHKFPAPIGTRRPMYTIHSEVATLPLSFKHKGCRECSFKIAFDPEFTEKVRFLRDLGMASHDEIELPGGGRVMPIAVVNKVAMSQPAPRQVGPLKQYEVVRAIVKGTKKGKKLTIVTDMHTAGMPKWGVGLDVDTGSPPAVAAQMLAAGEITETGAIPAEIAVPPEPFFKRIKLRKMTVKSARKTGWSFPT
ncbi:MAG: saccharopine dehydrogenase NADP-binding domain-containing protein [Deltaproteobacteria bacterium]|nr:saccharopine dehydrogenase NADP-binding domain-containing protein [Deltaproteobacteria bacterium]